MEASHKLVATLSRDDTRFAHLLHSRLLRACLRMLAQFTCACSDYLDLPLLLTFCPNLLKTPSARLLRTAHLLRSEPGVECSPALAGVCPSILAAPVKHVLAHERLLARVFERYVKTHTDKRDAVHVDGGAGV